MSKVAEITNATENNSFIANNNKSVIFFGSMMCSHCRDMIPVVEDLANEYPSVKFAHVEITEVDVDNVDGVPAFVGYKNHNPIDMVLGASPEKLRKMVETKLL